MRRQVRIPNWEINCNLDDRFDFFHRVLIALTLLALTLPRLLFIMEHPERAVLAHGLLYTPIPKSTQLKSLRPRFSLTTSCPHFLCPPPSGIV
jgi:hypothetical protein